MDQNQIKSGMFGLIVGDALGVPVEFESREDRDFDPVTDMRADPVNELPKGTWSDDSSMALCLMESLTHGLSYEDQMSQYVRWADEGYMTPYGEVFDMGISIRKALLRFLHGTPALSCGSTSVEENGNGSLMRILPLAMYLHAKLGANFPYQNQAYDIIHKASSLTHAHPISQMACSLYCCVANELLCRRARPEHLQNAIARGKVVYRVSEWAPWLEEFARVDIPTLRRLPRDAIQSSGYVVSTLEAALWCLLNTDSYRDCVLQAVNLGEDTDTVAAVAGGLAGLKYGMEDIPQPWLDTIPKREEIEGYCAAFAESLSLAK